MIKINVSNKELSIQTIEALQKFESDLREFIKTTLGRNEFINISTKCGLMVVKRTNQQVQIKHNASLSIPNSDQLNILIADYVSQYEELQVILPAHSLVVNLHYNLKKEDNNREYVYAPVLPRKTFSQLVLPSNVKKEIDEALYIVEHKDLIWNTWHWKEIDSIPRSVINLYGPPGTGKTACAHAIADKLGKKIIEIKYSEIESKYLGDSTKNLKRAFDDAAKSDSVIFFDEADSFLGKRIQNVTHSVDQALNSLRSQMLIQLEEFEGIVIFATNLVTNFDTAFESRILKHVRIDLPNKEARAEIIKVMVSPIPSEAISKEGFLSASELAEGLSGREIKGAILEMLLRNVVKGSDYIFSLEDIKETLNQKVISLKELKAEHVRQQKEKIRKTIRENAERVKLEEEVKNEEKIV